MGIGDEIIASGHAKSAYTADGRRVLICDVHGRPRWSPLWEGLQWIVHPTRSPMAFAGSEVFNRLADGPRCRPYIDYRKGFTRRTGMNYSGWRVRDHRGFIQLVDREMAFAAAKAKELGNFVVIEPLIEHSSNPNKQWGISRWQDLAFILAKERMNPIQIGPINTPRLTGVQHVITPDIRHGAALMKFARWSILPDAGLAHVAGALGLPATVLWGGANDPEVLGYPEHEAIYFPAECRIWMPCQHCRTIWQSLRADYVWERTRTRMVERYGENYRSR